MRVTATSTLVTAGAAVMVLSLTACGGSTEPERESTSAAPRGEDGLTPEERAVADAVQGYTDAYFNRGATAVGPAIQDLVTKDVYDLVVPAETRNVDEAGLQHLGEVTLSVDEVTIDGDSATVRGCQDASTSFIVKKGATEPGVGSSAPLGFNRVEYGLVRKDGVWLVSDPKGEQVPSC